MTNVTHIPWQGEQDYEFHIIQINNHTSRIETVSPDGKVIDAWIVTSNINGVLRKHTKDGPGVAESAHLSKILAA